MGRNPDPGSGLGGSPFCAEENTENITEDGPAGDAGEGLAEE